MLLVIGRGSFGEVWLARSLTGSMRAIKVIRREDFDHGGTYEREFEGILKYEPISRQHPGLVDILQVGRNDERHYYYYVMELADHAPRPPSKEEIDHSLKEDLLREENSPATESFNWSGRATPAGRLHGIEPDAYLPDILSRRIREQGSAPNTDVVRHGAALARGIAFLHSHGLVHRDIKPGNVVFIDGKAKLADVGLVTTAGDGTFVGTEGYVAPEGPGTPAADIFSLGMVLYEMSTGKDRLDFPDLPSVLPEGQERLIWRRVNRAICRAAARRPEARYRSGERLALALEGQANDDAENQAHKKKLILAASTVTLLTTATLVIATLLFNAAENLEPAAKQPPFPPSSSQMPGATITQSEPAVSTSAVQETPQPEAFATLEIKTSPPGADIYHGEQWLGTSPVFIDPAPSNAASYNIRLEGHRIEQIDYLGAQDDRQTIQLELAPWKFPQQGMRWQNSRQMTFFPSGDGHISDQPISADAITAFARQTGYALSGQAIDIGPSRHGIRFVAAISSSTAKAFCKWLTEHDQQEGILLPEQFYRPISRPVAADRPTVENLRVTSSGEILGTYFAKIDRIRYGSVAFSSEPAGATVHREGKQIGVTPFELPRIRTGRFEFEIRMKNYKTAFHSVEITDEKLTEADISLERGQGVDFTSPWRNSLGMLFLPCSLAPREILVSAFETRQREFASFMASDSALDASPVTAELTARPVHPITGITHAEAEAFCRWLTQLERRRGLISSRHVYRLPTDEEWSHLAGLPPERGRDPADRSNALNGFYVWGFQWPPPAGSGNFAGHESIGIAGIDDESIIPGFKDSQAGTAPAGSSPADPRGLYQVAGNVAEWVTDRFGGKNPRISGYGIVRGGSWRSWSEADLNASHRRAVAPATRADDIGFRVILSLAD